MRRMIGTSLVVGLLLGIAVLGSVTPAAAGTSTDIALGLASFAVFNQVVGALAQPRPYREVVVVHRSVVYAPPPVYTPTYAAPTYAVPTYASPAYAAPAPVVYAPAPTTVVLYPTGRYELSWQGQQYVWVWIPNVPLPPPPPVPLP